MYFSWEGKRHTYQEDQNEPPVSRQVFQSKNEFPEEDQVGKLDRKDDKPPQRRKCIGQLRLFGDDLEHSEKLVAGDALEDDEQRIIQVVDRDIPQGRGRYQDDEGGENEPFLGGETSEDDELNVQATGVGDDCEGEKCAGCALE